MVTGNGGPWRFYITNHLGHSASSARYARETHHVYRGRPDLPGVCASTPTLESDRGGLGGSVLRRARRRGSRDDIAYVFIAAARVSAPLPVTRYASVAIGTNWAYGRAH